MHALLDDINFYFSCERSVLPRLQGLPVVVHSNNSTSAHPREGEQELEIFWGYAPQ